MMSVYDPKESTKLNLTSCTFHSIIISQFWWAKLEEEQLMALNVASLIWLRHNDVVFGRVFSAHQGIVAAARKMVEEFSLVL
jgi:hypothetical protein